MAKMKLVKRMIYAIYWEDTWSVIRWKDIEDIAEQAKQAKEYIKTIGFYIGTFENFIVLAGSMNTNPEMSDWGMITYIPKGCIKRIQKLK